MFKRLDELHPAAIRELLDLRTQVPFKDAEAHRRRMGVSGLARLSNYKYSRYLTWNRHQRKTFLEYFPNHVAEKSLVNWFVYYPKGSGFLDRIETWVTDPSPSWLTCYCIAGNGRLLLDGVEVIVQQGQGITFPLSTPHEIPESLTGSVWACAMTMDNVWGEDSWEAAQ